MFRMRELNASRSVNHTNGDDITAGHHTAWFVVFCYSDLVILMKIGRTVLKESTKRTRSYRCRYYATNNINTDLDRQRRPVPGHPDDPSSILDAIGHTTTPSTVQVDAAINKSAKEIQSIQDAINVHEAGVNGGTVPSQKRFQTYEEMLAAIPDAPYASYEAYIEAKRTQAEMTAHGFHPDWERPYKPWEMLTNPPRAEELTLPMLLANQCHLGHATALWHPANSSYIFGIREGIHIISLEITMSYLRRAAKIIQEVAYRGGLILFVGTTKGMRDITVSAAKRAQGYHIFTRWIPGSLTNGQQILGHCDVSIVNAQDQVLGQYTRPLKENEAKRVLRPDLVVMLNAMDNTVCLNECGLYNVPTIGIVDTDVNPTWVTYPVPANDDSPRSVALVAGVLSRAAETGQQMRRKAADQGQTTYSTRSVTDYIESMKELAEASSQAVSSEGKEDTDDKRR